MMRITKLIRFLCFAVCALLIFGTGCDKQSKAPQKSEGVTKKISTAPKKATAKSKKASAKADEKAKSAGSPAQKDTDANKPVSDKAVSKGDVTESYNPEGKIDPFAPLFKEEQVIEKPAKKKKRRTPLTPLEKVDLSQLTLLGTILAPSSNRAMVRDASGKGYVVREGTYIGINAGRVVEILRDRIIVEEEVENILGKLALQKRELKLQKPPGEL